MKEYKIDWKKGDFISLGRAVSDFNKKINALNKEEKKLYLPETLKYKEVKEKIITRSELQRVIKSLRRFKKEGAEELYRTSSGEEITKWERKELHLQANTIKRRLKNELNKLNEPNLEGFSRIQMGSQRVREIESQLKNLEELETKSGYEFKRLVDRIKTQGRSDYVYRKAEIFRENFLKSLDELTFDEEFVRIEEYFEKITNPIIFFETTQKSNALQDFFLWYKRPDLYGNFTTSKELVDYILEEYK